MRYPQFVRFTERATPAVLVLPGNDERTAPPPSPLRQPPRPAWSIQYQPLLVARDRTEQGSRKLAAPAILPR
jgi:hypothetical protein